MEESYLRLINQPKTKEQIHLDLMDNQIIMEASVVKLKLA